MEVSVLRAGRLGLSSRAQVDDGMIGCNPLGGSQPSGSLGFLGSQHLLGGGPFI